MSKNKMITMVVGIIIVLAAVLWGVFGVGKSAKVTATGESVAKVNGVAITKEAYDTQIASFTASLKAQGLPTDTADAQASIKTQVLNDLISNELVMQGVKSSGTKATDAEVEAQFQTLVSQNGGKEGLTAALVKAGLTESQLRTNISNQLAIQKYLMANIKADSVSVTDAEVTAFYNDYKKAQGTTTPPLKDLSAQIKQQITLNKQQALVNEFIVSLRAKANVETSI